MGAPGDCPDLGLRSSLPDTHLHYCPAGAPATKQGSMWVYWGLWLQYCCGEKGGRDREGNREGKGRTGGEGKGAQEGTRDDLRLSVD